jgi:hypothetical protein
MRKVPDEGRAAADASPFRPGFITLPDKTLHQLLVGQFLPAVYRHELADCRGRYQ